MNVINNDILHRDIKRVRVQMGKHLEPVTQRQRHVLRVGGEIFVVKAPAIAAAMALRVKGEARHEHERRLVVGLRPVRDRLRDIVCARRDGRQIIQP